MNASERKGVVRSVDSWLESVRVWFGKRSYTRAERFVLKEFARSGARIRADEMRAAAKTMIAAVKAKKIRTMSKRGQLELRRMVELYVRDKTPLQRKKTTAMAFDPRTETLTLERIEEKHRDLPAPVRKKLAVDQIACIEKSAERSGARRVRRAGERSARKDQDRQRREAGVQTKPASGPELRKTHTASPSRKKRAKSLPPVKLEESTKRATKSWKEAPKKEKERAKPKVFDRTKALGTGSSTSTGLATRGQESSSLATRAEAAMTDETGIAVVTATPGMVEKATQTFGEAGAIAIVEEIENANACVYRGMNGLCFVDDDYGVPAFFVTETDHPPGESGYVLFHTHQVPTNTWGAASPLVSRGRWTFESVMDAMAFAGVAEEIFGQNIHVFLGKPAYDFLSWLHSHAALQGKILAPLEFWARELPPNVLIQIYRRMIDDQDGEENAQRALDILAESQVGLTYAFLILAKRHGPRLEELAWKSFNIDDDPSDFYFDRMSRAQADMLMSWVTLRAAPAFEDDLDDVMQDRELQLSDYDFTNYKKRVKDLLKFDLPQLSREGDAALDFADLSESSGSRVLLIDALALDSTLYAEEETTAGAYDRLYVQERLSFGEIANRFGPTGNHTIPVFPMSGGRYTLPEGLQDGLIANYADSVELFVDLLPQGASVFDSGDVSIEDFVEELKKYSELSFLQEVSLRLQQMVIEATTITGKSYTNIPAVLDESEIFEEATQSLYDDDGFQDIRATVEEAYGVGMTDEEVDEMVIDSDAWNELLSERITETTIEQSERFLDEVERLLRYVFPFTSYEYASHYIAPATDEATDEYYRENTTLGALFAQVYAITRNDNSGGPKWYPGNGPVKEAYDKFRGKMDLGQANLISFDDAAPLAMGVLLAMNEYPQR